MKPELVNLPISDEFKAYVYIIKFSSGNIKIGWSTNPSQRVKQLSNSNSGGFYPIDITISQQTIIADRLEQYLHNKFRQYRVSGEFFSGISYEDIVNELNHILNDRQFFNCTRARQLYIDSTHRNLTQYHKNTDENK